MSKAESEADDDPHAEYDRSAMGPGVRGKQLKRYQSGTNLALLAPEIRAAFPTEFAKQIEDDPWHPRTY